jgi:hypothetical protein
MTLCEQGKVQGPNEKNNLSKMSSLTASLVHESIKLPRGVDTLVYDTLLFGAHLHFGEPLRPVERSHLRNIEITKHENFNFPPPDNDIITFYICPIWRVQQVACVCTNSPHQVHQFFFSLGGMVRYK